jgi:hypothetical protein
MSMAEVEGGDRSSSLDTVVAVLIAVSTLVGAGLAWRSSVAGDAAGDADYAGLRSVVNVEETRATNAVNAYEHYAAFVNFDRQDELAGLIQEDRARGGNEAGLADARDLAHANRHLFPVRFLNRDGSYALQRELGEMWADAAREKDLNPEPQFDESERFRAKTLGLLAAVTVVAFALIFFTLVEPLGEKLQYVNLALGTLCLLTGTGLGLFYELLR